MQELKKADLTSRRRRLVLTTKKWAGLSPREGWPCSSAFDLETQATLMSRLQPYQESRSASSSSADASVTSQKPTKTQASITQIKLTNGHTSNYRTNHIMSSFSELIDRVIVHVVEFVPYYWNFGFKWVEKDESCPECGVYQ